MDEEHAMCQCLHKTGYFQLRYHELGFQFQSLTERINSIQIERDGISGDISTLVVKWTSDREYELRLISSTKPFPDSIQQLRKTVLLHTEILGGTANYYLFKCYRANADFVITDTMWVQK